MARRRRNKDFDWFADFLMIPIYLFCGVFFLVWWLCLKIAEMFRLSLDEQCPDGVIAAEVIDRIQWTRGEYKNSGMSIGLKGNPRLYFRAKDVPYRVEVKFLVEFQDGSVKTISATEGSKRYDYLMYFVKMKAQRKERAAAPPPPSEPQQTIPPRLEEKHEEPRPAKPKSEKYYVSAQFETSTNEFNLSIHYPSCQMEIFEDGSRKMHVRMEVHYDPSVKGVRNRTVVCGAVDAQGRMTDKMRCFNPLDLSGSKLVDITFWKNVEQEPAKIIVSLEHYN